MDKQTALPLSFSKEAVAQKRRPILDVHNVKQRDAAAASKSNAGARAEAHELEIGS
jgi:hypothetical protein